MVPWRAGVFAQVRLLVFVFRHLFSPSKPHTSRVTSCNSSAICGYHNAVRALSFLSMYELRALFPWSSVGPIEARLVKRTLNTTKHASFALFWHWIVFR
jgi:hypothetical protein